MTACVLWLGGALYFARVPVPASVALAYLTAATYGLGEEAARLQEVLVAAKLPVPEVRCPPFSSLRTALPHTCRCRCCMRCWHAWGYQTADPPPSPPPSSASVWLMWQTIPDAVALLPPTPIVREESWPLLTVARSAFDPTYAGPAEGEW